MTATGVGYLVPEPPMVPPNATVVPHDAGATLTVSDFAKIHTNTGDIDSQEHILPAAKDAAGCSIRFATLVAAAIVLAPVSGEKIFLAGSGVADEKLTIAGVIGNYAEIYSDGAQYHVVDYDGVLTKAA